MAAFVLDLYDDPDEEVLVEKPEFLRWVLKEIAPQGLRIDFLKNLLGIGERW